MQTAQESREGQAAAASADAPALAATQSPDVAPTRPPAITIVGADGKPQTLTIPSSTEEVEQLIAQREELEDQLDDVSDRRSTLAQELAATTDQAARVGLQERLAVLDQRILQLETDLGTTGRLITSAPAELVAITEQEHMAESDDGYEAGLFAGGFSVLAFISVALFLWRRPWRRARAARAAAGAEVGAESSQRLERLEHGMDAIALEIERISEGQRFVTRLLSEAEPGFGKSKRLAESATPER